MNTYSLNTLQLELIRLERRVEDEQKHLEHNRETHDNLLTSIEHLENLIGDLNDALLRLGDDS